MQSFRADKSLVILLLSEIFLSLGIGFISYAQPFLYSTSGLNDHVIGLLFSVNSIVGGITALVGGSVADRIGTTKVFRFASLMLPLGYLIVGLVVWPSWWFFSSCLTGFGGALLLSTENVVMKSLTVGIETSSALSKFTSMYTFVIGGGIVISGFISPHLGYRDTLILGAILALVAPVMRLWVKADDTRSDRMFKLPSKRIAIMSIYALVFSFGTGLFNPFLTLVLHNHFGFHDSITGIISSASTFMMAFGAFVVTSLQRRLNRRRTLALAFAGSSVLTFAMAFTSSGWLFTGLFLVRAVLASVPISIVDAIFLNLSEPTEYAQMFGVRVFGMNVGNGAGSYVGGNLLEHQELSVLLILSAVAIALGYVCLRAILHYLGRRRMRMTDTMMSDPFLAQ